MMNFQSCGNFAGEVTVKLHGVQLAKNPLRAEGQSNSVGAETPAKFPAKSPPKPHLSARHLS